MPGPPEAPPGGQAPPRGSWPPAEGQVQPQPGWGAPQPDQSSNKTMLIAGCLILFVLVLIILPIAIFMLTAPRFIDEIRDLATFPPDFPFPSFFP